MATISSEERSRLKSAGILSNRDGEHFSIRVITENGVLSAEKSAVLAEAARRYGNGNLAFTSRMTVELGDISYDDLPHVLTMLEQGKMETGGTGKKVRPVVACKGTVCVYGLIDTQALALEIHHRFYEGYRKVLLPHKFKIAVGGCPNNCVKPDLNDVGIVGQRKPRLNPDICRRCKKCAAAGECPMGAIDADSGNFPLLHPDRCNHCGRCIKKCPFGAMEEQQAGYRVILGGRWGKSVRIGTPLPGIFTREQALDLIEQALLLFLEQGLPGERFSTAIERLGIDQVKQQLLSGDLLRRKEQILG